VTHSPFPWKIVDGIGATGRTRVVVDAVGTPVGLGLRDNIELVAAVEQMAIALVAARHALGDDEGADTMTGRAKRLVEKALEASGVDTAALYERAFEEGPEDGPRIEKA
jgi:hypothetical protein